MGIDDLSDVRIVCFYYEYVVLIYLVPRTRLWLPSMECIRALFSVRFLFERSEFQIPTWITPQYRATSKKKKLYVCSTNLGFSGGSANRKNKWNHTNVPPVNAHVWRQLHLSAVDRCSDSCCIFYILWSRRWTWWECRETPVRTNTYGPPAGAIWLRPRLCIQGISGPPWWSGM